MKEFKKILIRSAKILDKHSPFHLQTVDLFIDASVITEIAKKLPSYKGAYEIDADGAFLSLGWTDLRCFLADPGFETREDLTTGLAAAARGGFSRVCSLPNTDPPIQSKSDILYLSSKSASSIVDVLPVVALSRNLDGKEITEMMDLHQAGASAFSDGIRPLGHPDVMLKALLYAKNFNGLVINRPEEVLLSQNGHMHEGAISTRWGVRGRPAIAEEIMVDRDLQLLEHSEGRLHLSCISTADSVKKIKAAKKRGLKVTCDVAIHQLIFQDSDMLPFDTHFKVNPPFRGKRDQQALIKGLEDHTIDAIVSDHRPLNLEHKDLEFDLASFGLIGFQSFLPWMVQLSNNIDWTLIIDKITTGPAEVLGLDTQPIGVGAASDFTIFDKKLKWMYDHESNSSKSRNSPVFGKELVGKVVAIVKGKRVEQF